jgi:tetratricopeptide (TPR) repeat protein
VRALFLALAFVLVALPAFADPADDARDAFKAGVAAFQKGDFETALAKFRAAEALNPAPAITYNVARSLEKLERPQAAVTAYEAYIAAAGENGDFTSASTLAIAQIKARSTRLRIESQPPGASVTLDGEKLAEKTPTSVLVPRGAHTIELELDGWKETRSYDAPGSGTTGELVFVRSQTPVSESARADRAPTPEKKKPRMVPTLDGLVGSFGLSLSLYKFVGTAEEGDQSADSRPSGLVFGLAFDVGYALGPHTELVFRGSGGLGSKDGALATIGAGALVLGHRLTQKWWVGGGVAFGTGNATDVIAANGDEINVATDLALGPSLELGYVIDQNDDGHWLAELLPTALLSTSGSPSTLFIPLVVGYRWF